MVWNQLGDFIDLYPDPHSSNFVDPAKINPGLFIGKIYLVIFYFLFKSEKKIIKLLLLSGPGNLGEIQLPADNSYQCRNVDFFYNILTYNIYIIS